MFILLSCNESITLNEEIGDTASTIFQFEDPAIVKVNSSESSTITLSRTTGSGSFIASKVSINYTGTANCSSVTINKLSTSSGEVSFSNCTGDGHFQLHYKDESSVRIRVNNTVQTLYSSAFDIALNNNEDYAYVVDTGTDAVTKVDLATGLGEIVSDVNIGGGDGGATFGSPVSIKLSTNESAAFVLDNGRDAIFSVDLTTGYRTVITGLGVGSGTSLSNPTRIELNSAQDKIYVIDRGLSALLEVDIATGARTVISSNSDSLTPTISTPYGMAINQTDDAMYVINRDGRNLISINLSTGVRTLISDSTLGTGNNFSTPHGLTLSSDYNYGYVNDQGSDAIFKVNLATGDREILSSSSVGNGVNFVSTLGFTLNGDNTIGYAVDSSTAVEGIIRVDLESGDRSIVSN